MREPEMGFIVVDNRENEQDLFLIGIYPHPYYHDSIGVWQDSVLIEDRKIKGIYENLQSKHCAFATFKPLPESEKANDQKEIQLVFFQIKQQVQDIAEVVMERMLNDPAKEHLIIKK